MDDSPSAAATLKTLQAKYDALRASIENIGERGGMIVAFSGGIDSMVLLKVAQEVLGSEAIAATVRSPFYPKREFEEARDFCRLEEIEHVVVDFDPLSLEGLEKNPPDRCYRCKRALLGLLVEIASTREIPCVAEGSNADDLADYRPGRRAVEELGVISPLLDEGFSKDEIRLLGLSLGIENWDKPSSACLASRFPFGEGLTRERLAMVEAAEDLLHDAGFTSVRVRAHGKVARVELPKDDWEGFVDYAESERFADALRALGFDFVSLDLDGLRSGSMNATLDA